MKYYKKYHDSEEWQEIPCSIALHTLGGTYLRPEELLEREGEVITPYATILVTEGTTDKYNA